MASLKVLRRILELWAAQRERAMVRADGLHRREYDFISSVRVRGERRGQ